MTRMPSNGDDDPPRQGAGVSGGRGGLHKRRRTTRTRWRGRRPLGLGASWRIAGAEGSPTSALDPRHPAAEAGARGSGIAPAAVCRDDAGRGAPDFVVDQAGRRGPNVGGTGGKRGRTGDGRTRRDAVAAWHARVSMLTGRRRRGAGAVPCGAARGRIGGHPVPVRPAREAAPRWRDAAGPFRGMPAAALSRATWPVAGAAEAELSTGARELGDAFTGCWAGCRSKALRPRRWRCATRSSAARWAQNMMRPRGVWNVNSTSCSRCEGTLLRGVIDLWFETRRRSRWSTTRPAARSGTGRWRPTGSARGSMRWRSSA
jgi:hypothetical protein